jgi:hypothetical protein
MLRSLLGYNQRTSSNYKEGRKKRQYYTFRQLYTVLNSYICNFLYFYIYLSTNGLLIYAVLYPLFKYLNLLDDGPRGAETYTRYITENRAFLPRKCICLFEFL